MTVQEQAFEQDVSDHLKKIKEAETLEALEAIRIELLGKKGQLTEAMKGLGKLEPEIRKAQGQALNKIKQELQTAIDDKKAKLELIEQNQKLVTQTIDLTKPIDPGASSEGRYHPITVVTQEIVSIFDKMGFSVAEGPDIETDFYNFTALNFPEGHPAREMHDTFFFKPDEKGERKVLRTHTSPVQIRTLTSQKPPVRVIIPGRTYRCDSDQTHTPMFHQCEGLVIDRQSSFAELKWVLETFCKEFFEVESVKMRFRPSFFPFTEPSMEVDIGCSREKGELRIGEGEDWLEILGCGMVHPNVLRNCDLDPEEFQGFAWGMGIDRLAMLKYGMPDLRAFFENDERWLSHYGFKAFETGFDGGVA
jgi:phenylalanyl-tRNA synthetase alpha chain